MDGQRVDFNFLPSHGVKYPDDIEIYVEPLPIKQQIDMERYGISDAEYFEILLNGVHVHGNFPRNKLLHSDVQFLDVVRRLYTFDTSDSITIKDVECPYRDCDGKVDYTFKINEIDFTASEDRHLFNDIYENILKDLQSAGNSGEFYTPRPVTQFIIDMLNPQLGEKVADFACGTGGFLTCAIEHLKKQQV